MKISVQGQSRAYTFEGPFVDASYLNDESGVYLIVCYDGESYSLIDVGESAEVKKCVDTHERADNWNPNCDKVLMYAVYYTKKTQDERLNIEKDIRAEHDFPCGN